MCTRRSTIPRSDTSVCGITIQRLSVRIVCRVREISGRYKFGEEFALSIDGDRRPRASSTIALRASWCQHASTRLSSVQKRFSRLLLQSSSQQHSSANGMEFPAALLRHWSGLPDKLNAM